MFLFLLFTRILKTFFFLILLPLVFFVVYISTPTLLLNSSFLLNRFITSFLQELIHHLYPEVCVYFYFSPKMRSLNYHSIQMPSQSYCSWKIFFVVFFLFFLLSLAYTDFTYFCYSPFPISFCFYFTWEKKRTFSFPQLLSHSETCYFYTYVVLLANYSLTVNKTTCLYTDGGLHLQFSFCDRQIIFFDVIAGCILNVLLVMHID